MAKLRIEPVYGECSEFYLKNLRR